MKLLDWPTYAFYMVVTMALLVVFWVIAVKPRAKIPGRLQSTVEAMMEFLRDTFMSALGPGGERHLPLVFALFWYILFCNLIELIPFFRAATANPSTTIGLGIIVFFYTQYVGIKAKGFVEYAKHFVGPLLILAPLFIIIEILGEFIKPFSLGMRLFGNIYAEDVMNDLAAGSVPLFHIGTLTVGIPLQIIVYPLQIFTGVIQAFIFAMLTCAYIGIMSETHHDNGDGFNSHPHQETDEERKVERSGDMAVPA
jgi:F-type H+-transporting ATPase subunit a